MKIFRTMSALSMIACGLAGCVQAPGNLQPDFGSSVRQAVAAQIADPGARYKRTEPPASSGARTALAQDRYEKGKVLQPATTATSSAVKDAGGGGKE